MIAFCGYTCGKMNVNGVSTISGHVTLVMENILVVLIQNRSIGLIYSQTLLQHAAYLCLKMSVNGASMISGYASWVIRMPIGCRQSYRNYWPPLNVNQIVIPFLPHLGNERQRSMNDCWLCILANLGGDRLQSVINEVVATFIGKRESQMLAAASSKSASTERQWSLAFHHG